MRPIIGDYRVVAIGTPDVLRVLSPIWLTKPETARRVRQRIATVLDWAKAAGYRLGDNPVEGVSRGPLGASANARKLASVATRPEIGPTGSPARFGPPPVALRAFLLLYVHYLHIQTRSTALSNARGKLEDRLARWLLMCDDRTVGSDVTVTHDFLAVMLGVRRPGVTIALQILEGRGLIWSRRGEVAIRDRDGLVGIADGYYGQAEAEYALLLG